MKKLSCILACVGPLLFAAAGEAVAQSASAPYLTGSRYLDGGLLAGTISPAASGSSNFPAVRNTYDSYGRLQKVEVGVLSSWQAETVLPANWSGFSVLKVQSFSYDADGRKSQDTLADGSGNISNIIQYSYDPYNRLTCTATRMNPAVFGSLPSDACTLGTQGSNGPDRVTTNSYDALDRVIQARRAVGTSLEQAYATYSYTVDGKQQDILDANGNHTLQSYDGHDRLVTTAFPSPTGPSSFNPATQATALSTAGAANGSDYEGYGYDANGNRTSLRKRDGSTIAYQYDALNRMTVKDLPGGTASDVYYDYDNRGLMLDAKFASLGGVGTSFAFDFAGRKTSETNYGQTVSYQYDNDGNRTRLTWPDGYYTSYGYDGLNRMQTAKENGSTLLATYSYDQLQRVALLQYGSGSGPSIGLSWSTWDDLLTLSHTMVSGSSVSFSDSYSPAHQILQSSISNPAYQYYPAFAGTVAYAPNGLNQYHLITPPGGSAATIGYDANGNLTSDGTFSYGYDPENRLTTASQTGVSASYLYDPQGRRRQKQVTGGSYAGTTQFLDAGDDEISQYDGSGTLLNRYIPGREVDRPIVMLTASGEKRYFHWDKTGSVIAMSTNTSVRSEGPYTYDPYGNCLGGGVPCTGGVPFKYTGRRYDPETGLYYYRARYYSPAIGRFLQTDPIGYKDDINLYAYVGNDPTNKTDPSGLCEDRAGLCQTIYQNPDLQSPISKDGSSGQTSSDRAGSRDANGGLKLASAAGAVKVWEAELEAGLSAAGTRALGALSVLLSLTGDTPQQQDQFVVRGGTCTTPQFCGGKGVTVDPNGNLQGVSVNSFPNTSVQQLSQSIPNKQIGVTTSRLVQDQGGVVTPAPSPGNPYHAILGGITPAQAQAMFKPTIRNPNR